MRVLKYVVTTNARANKVSIIDSQSYQVITEIEVGADPHEITFINY